MDLRHILLGFLIASSGCAGVGDFEPGPATLRIDMWVEQMDWEIAPGVTTPTWAFCAEGDGVEPVWGAACGVPGPTIRAVEGDTIILTFRNTHHIPHTVHFHGWHGWDADMTGNRLLGDHMVVEAGETQTIRWVAEPSGSFIYHCHFDTPGHMEMGMYGAFIVEDRDAAKPDIEHVAVLDEWQIRDEPSFHGNMPDYNFFTISGKSFPLTQPIIAQPGDSVRIHMVNAGYEFHAMHLHGYTPTAYEGVAGPAAGFLTDVKEIAPGQTVVLDFVADREGIWLFHDHVVPRVTAASDGSGFGAYPRGMLTVLVVGDDYLDALTAVVPDLLAAAAGDVDAPESHDHSAHEAEPAQPAGPVGGPAQTVAMKDYKFARESVTIQAGTTVNWPNRDPVVHTVTFVGGPDSGDIAAGETFSYTFTEPGTYQYYCKPHAFQDDGEWTGMVATIVVE